LINRIPTATYKCKNTGIVASGVHATPREHFSSSWMTPCGNSTSSLLRRFLGVLNFYRRFLQQAAASQAPLYNALSGPRVKGSHPTAFEEYKPSLSLAILLAHPVTDCSATAMGAVLQQRVKKSWQPFAFFSKKLNST
jgi:cleavage and polyadenylation specificity factor subunit 1